MASVIRGTDNFDSAGGNVVKAWVNFNGTGSVQIRAAFNVSFITDNGVGLYAVNFTNPLPNANYSVAGIARNNIGQAVFNIGQTTSAQVTTTSAFSFQCSFMSNVSPSFQDSDMVTVQFFG